MWQNLFQLHRNHERQLPLELPRTLTDTLMASSAFQGFDLVHCLYHTPKSFQFFHKFHNQKT